MADHAYADYVEFIDGSSPSSTTPAPRKSLWAAAVSTVLLVGASVAYTGGVDTPSFKWPWDATDSGKHFTAVAKPPAFKATSSLMAQQTARPGNRVILTFPNGPIQDGTVARGKLSVAEWASHSPPSTVELASQGLRCTPCTFSFTPYTLEQVVSCRTVTGFVSAADHNNVVDVPVTFSYPFSPFCNAETQNVQRLRLSAGRCSAWGDPHLTTFDGVNYDFQPDGVFRYFTANGLEVQVFQEKCPPTNTGKTRAPSCYRAMSIIYADSVLRLSLDDTNKITVIRGTESMRWFELYKFGGKTEGYRIFLLADDTSYIDITVGYWVMNYGYLNIVAQLSPFFRDPNMLGLMGNWNGNPADDSRDVNALTIQNRYPMDDNAFVCTDCSRWTRAPSETDELARQMRVPSMNLHQGFSIIDIDSLPLQTYTPAFRTLPQVAAVAFEAASNVSERAKELCPQVINGVPICAKYVPNREFFIKNVCIADATLVGDISTVESTKIAYLRECRGEIEALILGAVGEPETIKALTEDRDQLEFGDLTLCPQNCNGQGVCLADGCECNTGFTGYTCDITI